MSFPRPTPFLGMKEDLEKRLPLYASDFTDFMNVKVSASILYMCKYIANVNFARVDLLVREEPAL
jgi:hypothetical protein